MRFILELPRAPLGRVFALLSPDSASVYLWVSSVWKSSAGAWLISFTQLVFFSPQYAQYAPYDHLMSALPASGWLPGKNKPADQKKKKSPHVFFTVDLSLQHFLADWCDCWASTLEVQLQQTLPPLRKTLMCCRLTVSWKGQYSKLLISIKSETNIQSGLVHVIGLPVCCLYKTMNIPHENLTLILHWWLMAQWVRPVVLNHRVIWYWAGRKE